MTYNLFTGTNTPNNSGGTYWKRENEPAAIIQKVDPLPQIDTTNMQVRGALHDDGLKVPSSAEAAELIDRANRVNWTSGNS